MGQVPWIPPMDDRAVEVPEAATPLLFPHGRSGSTTHPSHTALLAPSMPPPSSAGHGPGPSSQVTADVVKFRCLFTHDLRRKSKRWQDGYLRFHTFNRRIMVFDEQGNFIGDHHWRSGGQVQDGDEMELDKGALIQVGECMGTAQTDLSSLLEKRKPSQGSPQSETQPRPSSLSARPQATQSRSLNDMLGIKRTPIAHLVSPYEERHRPKPVENVRPSQPPPKRQKTSAVDSSAQRPVVDLTQSKKNSKPMRSAPTVTSTRGQPRPAADSQRARSSVSNDASNIAPLTKPSSNVDSTCPPALKPAASRPAPTFSSRGSIQDAPPSSAQLPERPQVPRNGLLAKSRSFAGPSSDTPMNTLRMAVEKPRKKLMYQALLPSEKSEKAPSELSMPPPKKPSSRPVSTSVEMQSVRAHPVL
ncbi:hypothetical protein N7510_003167 [Penicillium lagena]|uniref:uncharacterized protein n=1 Tax=Penicillium lagena TaxID=94218 RepID=UPI002541F9DF|nr:uncharacterized protein N7510_003167 [Penicillium lagena]KAJ5619183.1 hypothetical protein N7510_003167 [Penicillium lagena]